jgi:hypothetical protein
MIAGPLRGAVDEPALIANDPSAATINPRRNESCALARLPSGTIRRNGQQQQQQQQQQHAFIEKRRYILMRETKSCIYLAPGEGVDGAQARRSSLINPAIDVTDRCRNGAIELSPADRAQETPHCFDRGVTPIAQK